MKVELLVSRAAFNPDSKTSIQQPVGTIVEMDDKEAEKYIAQNWAKKIETPKRGRPAKEPVE